MDSAKNQLAEALKDANNILVSVSRNPSVDQLAASLGLSLLLNKLGKHAALVFSGEVPSTIEFLKPEETIEKNTDSLRDFIIALDKRKADKLRYKVEDDVVRIFITPYKTSISQDDLDFSQGDFNVDVVVALGVHEQQDLDEAITAHGRILHDATVTSINTQGEGGLGSIVWQDPQASSLSELVTELGQALGEDIFDNQIATALLTGIVAETNRFSNDKTSSETMRASATLMAAGADQQLVASKLDEQPKPKDEENEQEAELDGQQDDNPPEANDGTIHIEHDKEQEPEEAGEEATESADTTPEMELPEPVEGDDELLPDDDTPNHEQSAEPEIREDSKLVTEPPALGGMLTANSQPERLDPAVDPMSMLATDDQPMLTHEPETSQEEMAAGTTQEEVQEPAAEEQSNDENSQTSSVANTNEAVQDVETSEEPVPTPQNEDEQSAEESDPTPVAEEEQTPGSNNESEVDSSDTTEDGEEVQAEVPNFTPPPESSTSEQPVFTPPPSDWSPPTQGDDSSGATDEPEQSTPIMNETQDESSQIVSSQNAVSDASSTDEQSDAPAEQNSDTAFADIVQTPDAPANQVSSENPAEQSSAADTLAELEATLQDPAQQADATAEDAARDSVSQILNNAEPQVPEPIQALNAQPLGDPLHDTVEQPAEVPNLPPMEQPVIDADPTAVPSNNAITSDPTVNDIEGLQLNTAPTAPDQASTPQEQQTPEVSDPNSPPPVPPPLPPTVLQPNQTESQQ